MLDPDKHTAKNTNTRHFTFHRILSVRRNFKKLLYVFVFFYVWWSESSSKANLILPFLYALLDVTYVRVFHSFSPHFWDFYNSITLTSILTDILIFVGSSFQFVICCDWSHRTYSINSLKLSPTVIHMNDNFVNHLLTSSYCQRFHIKLIMQIIHLYLFSVRISIILTDITLISNTDNVYYSFDNWQTSSILTGVLYCSSRSCSGH